VHASRLKLVHRSVDVQMLSLLVCCSVTDSIKFSCIDGQGPSSIRLV
jgi:hypothetical protein